MPAAGVPASVAVPLPLLVNVTPVGSVPVRVNVAAGKPVVVMVNVPARHHERRAVRAGDRRRLVDRQGEALLRRRRPTPLVAVIVSG